MTSALGDLRSVPVDDVRWRRLADGALTSSADSRSRRTWLVAPVLAAAAVVALVWWALDRSGDRHDTHPTPGVIVAADHETDAVDDAAAVGDAPIGVAAPEEEPKADTQVAAARPRERQLPGRRRHLPGDDGRAEGRAEAAEVELSPDDVIFIYETALEFARSSDDSAGAGVVLAARMAATSGDIDAAVTEYERAVDASIGRARRPQAVVGATGEPPSVTVSQPDTEVRLASMPPALPECDVTPWWVIWEVGAQ